MVRKSALAAAMAASCIAAGPAHAALVVSKGATSNVTCASGVCVATAVDAVLNVKELKQRLKTAGVVVASGAAAKDIVFAGEFSWAKPTHLTLDAWRGIVVAKPLTSQGSGGVTLTTNDGGTGGDIAFQGQGRIAFWDLSSALVIDGVSYTLVNSLASLATAIAANPQGALALANNYDASVDGTYPGAPVATELHGTFEGLGHVVSNLTIVKKWSLDGGLFAQIAADGTVRDIRLSNVNVSDNTTPGDKRRRASNAGGLAARNLGAIVDAGASGSVKSKAISAVGGLVGYNQGTILRSHAAVAVSGGGRRAAVGGLVGVLDEGGISDSSATGTVTGGLIGTSGGLVGYSNGTIERSYASGEVVGGHGQTTSEGFNPAFTGGLVGNNDNGSVTQSYSTGTVHFGTESYSGGLIGAYGTISQSYTVGAVTPENLVPCDICTGAFIGLLSENPASGDYWDVDTSGTTRATGDGDAPGITGLSDTQLKSGLPSAFDPAVWGQSEGINDGYPYLLANPPQ